MSASALRVSGAFSSSQQFVQLPSISDILQYVLSPLSPEGSTAPDDLRLSFDLFMVSAGSTNVPRVVLVDQNKTTSSVDLVERLDSIKATLNLSMTQLAELFQVTRKTVYDWYDGSAPRENAEIKIRIVSSVLLDSKIDTKRLKTVWKIPFSGKSFLDTLNSNNLTEEELRVALIEKLHDLDNRLPITQPVPRENADGRIDIGDFVRDAGGSLY